MAKVNKAQADEAVKQAYRDYNNLLIKYCRIRLKDVPDAIDDCLQNTYLAYYKRLLSGEEIKNTKPFLYRVADNMVKRTVADYSKNAKRHTDLDNAKELSAQIDFDSFSNSEIDYDILKERLINRLNNDEQFLYRMKYEERKSLKEIGETLNIPPSAVANRTSRLRTKIKRLISETIEEIEGGRLS